MPAKNPLLKARRQAAEQQQFRCFYCCLPMWETSPRDIISTYSLTRKNARLLRCTAEHLKARCEGGKDTPDNIVAACLYCNRSRHQTKAPLAPGPYRAFVRDEMSQGRWLAAMFKETRPAMA